MNVIDSMEVTPAPFEQLSELELEQVGGGFNDWEVGGIAIIGLATATTATAAFGFPIGLAMLGLGIYRSWRRPNHL